MRKAGYSCVAGVDEAGRGPLAGPVVASACVLKDMHFINRIDDSKKLSPKARENAYSEIVDKAVIGIGVVGEQIIDKINIYRAAALAMEKAVQNLLVLPDMLLIDGRIKLNIQCKKTCIIKGDSKSLSIACASIVAKVTRDNMMLAYDREYPLYGFRKHKGYGTRQHKAALKKHGPLPIHRFSFSPVRAVSGKEEYAGSLF